MNANLLLSIFLLGNNQTKDEKVQFVSKFSLILFYKSTPSCLFSAGLKHKAQLEKKWLNIIQEKT